VSDSTDDHAELEQLDASGLFDAAWYLVQYPDVRDAELEPLVHFYRFGWREHRRPNRYFDPEWYLEHYPDVRAAGMNPLLHYVRHGDHEGRRPVWHFDPAWYRDAYEIPSDALTLAHFLTQRTSGHFAPMPELWAVLHLAPYRDDPAAGDDPFERYLDDMMREQRDRSRSGCCRRIGLIDPNYYLINGTDARGQLDPAEHFCRHGWREGASRTSISTRAGTSRPIPGGTSEDRSRGALCSRRRKGRAPAGAVFRSAWYRETYAIRGTSCAGAFPAASAQPVFSPTRCSTLPGMSRGMPTKWLATATRSRTSCRRGHIATSIPRRHSIRRRIASGISAARADSSAS
jgi:hypothetical protein